MATPAEIEAGAEVLYGPEWPQTLDPRGKDEARNLARKVLEAAEACRPALFLGSDIQLHETHLRPGAIVICGNID